MQQTSRVTASKTHETKAVIQACLKKEGEEDIRIYYAAEIDCLNEGKNYRLMRTSENEHFSRVTS